MRIECPNYLMREKTKKLKDKGLVATLNDTENDSSDEYVDECGNFMAKIIYIYIYIYILSNEKRNIYIYIY